MSHVTEPIIRMNAAQITMALFFIVAAILIVFVLVRNFCDGVTELGRRIYSRLARKKPAVRVSNRFKNDTDRRDDVNNIKDALYSILLLVACAIVVLCGANAIG